MQFPVIYRDFVRNCHLSLFSLELRMFLFQRLCWCWRLYSSILSLLFLWISFRLLTTINRHWYFNWYAPQRVYSRRFVRPSVRPSDPAFGTYGFIFCMKIVGKLIKGFIGFRKRVIMGLCKLINSSVPAN